MRDDGVVLQLSGAARRRRLGTRHGLAQAYDDPESATRAMTVLHATEAATVHLALWARTEGVTIQDVDEALYGQRSIVKQLAMRRTLFVFPRDLLPAAWGSAALRVARQQRAQLAKNVAAAGLANGSGAVDGWIDDVVGAVLEVLSDGAARTTREVRAGRHPLPLRQQRQRRQHRVVERPDRRFLGPGRPGPGGARAAAGARRPGEGRPFRARAAGRAPHRLARRRTDHQRLRLAADAWRTPALTYDSPP